MVVGQNVYSGHVLSRSTESQVCQTKRPEEPDVKRTPEGERERKTRNRKIPPEPISSTSNIKVESPGKTEK